MLDFVTKTIEKLFRSKSSKDIKEIRPYISLIHTESKELLSSSDENLRKKSADLRKSVIDQLSVIDTQVADLKKKVENEERLDINFRENIFNQIDDLEKKQNEKLENILMDILPPAFALIKETSRRLKENQKLQVCVTPYDEEIASKKAYVQIKDDQAIWLNKWEVAGNEIVWDMVHYDVQLIGGIILHQGKIAEMATGEGKTLVATLPSFLNALSGRGVHIVTVNDYLARRDAEWMAPIMEFHGLRVTCIDNYEPHSKERREAYKADVIYGTNNEFGFDYLRDNMARNKYEQVQRHHHFAMVDEVDSVLIDDARTPLIISGPVSQSNNHEFYELKPRVEKLIIAQKKLVITYLNKSKKFLFQNKNEEGCLDLLRAYRGLPKNKPLIKYLSEQGVRKKLQKTENIYLQENSKRMPEVDKTLFFTIDEKNSTVDLTEKGIDLITKQGENRNFFILPDIAIDLDNIDKRKELNIRDKLIEKEKIVNDYTVKTQRIHTINQLLKAYTLFEKDVDYIISNSKVKIVDEQTGRILEGRRYSDGLHQALEAKENVSIEDATQTYATITLQNYFRMYHKLAGMTGTAETEAGEFWQIYKLDVVVIPTNKSIIRNDREDKIYKTVREKFNAATNEIQEIIRQKRPVLVGTTSVENSELLSRMLKFKKISHQVLNAKYHAREAEIIARAGLPGNITIATNMAGRGTDIKLTSESRKSGGLAIIGTERHESRRVDRQLRGRSGRQGDPGSSQFFVSLEDNLMRLFGSERITKVMDKMGYKEGEVIQHSMVTRSIERAQKKVEENNFAIRKKLLEYDNVMNSQREIIYKKRKNSLYGDRLPLDIMNSFYEIASYIIDTCQGDYNAFKLYLMRIFGISTNIEEKTFLKNNTQLLTHTLYEKTYQSYTLKCNSIKKETFPTIEHIYKTKGKEFNYIAVPFSDKSIQLSINVNLKEAVETRCECLVQSLEQVIMITTIDRNWTEHLREMDELKQQVQNVVFEQKDPLLIYKFEAFELFKNFIRQINEESVAALMKTQLVLKSESSEKTTSNLLSKNFAYENDLINSSSKKHLLKESKQESTRFFNKSLRSAEKSVEKVQPIKKEKTYGRNEKITVKYTNGTVISDVKHKAVAQDIYEKKCIVLEKK